MAEETPQSEADSVLGKIAEVLYEYQEAKDANPVEYLGKVMEAVQSDTVVTEGLILHDMFTTMVHNTPGRIVSISSGGAMTDGSGNEYEDHELRFRMKEEVVEAFCQTCLVPKEA